MRNSLEELPYADRMTLIKLLLLCGVAVFAVLAYRSGGSATQRAVWRIGASLVLVLAVVSVLLPEVVTSVANAVGVGRGADLVLYVLAIAFLISVVTLFRRLAELDRRTTSLVREIALLRADRDLPGRGD